MFCEKPNGRFPCGKCRACRLRKANEKMILSIFAAHEYKKKGQFLTLTFNDVHVPPELDHQIFSGFMKRLRRRDGTPDVKFHVAGEYGEKNGRPHFHVLFYNHKYDMNDVNRSWADPYTGDMFGFTYDGTLTPKSMKYVSGYVNKRGYDPGSGKRPPYGRTSVLLPDGLTPEEILSMCKTGKIQYNGRKFSVPQNWRRRYNQIWKRFEEDRSWYNFEYRPENELTPDQVRAIMDMRDTYMAAKRGKRKKAGRMC